MSADLPIWPTAKAVIAYTWRERAFAVRYAVVPVILLIALDGVGTAFNVDIGGDQAWQFVSAIAALIASAPLIVTWYLAILVGPEEARRRPIFVLGRREITVALKTTLIQLIAMLSAFPMICVTLLIGGGIATVNEIAAEIVTVAGVVLAICMAAVVFTCISIAVAASALGRHLRLRDALKATWPIAARFTSIHAILAVIGIGIGEGATALIGYGLEASGLGGVEGERAPIPDLIVAATDTTFGVIYLLLATTLFGFVYRNRLAQDDAYTAPP